MTLWKLLLAWVTASLRLLQDDLILCLSHRACTSPGHTALTHFVYSSEPHQKRSPWGQLGGCCSCSLPLSCLHKQQRGAAPTEWGVSKYELTSEHWAVLSLQLRLGLYLEAITLSIILTGNQNTNLALEYFSVVIIAFCKSNLQQSLPSSTQQSEHWSFKWDKAVL